MRIRIGIGIGIGIGIHKTIELNCVYLFTQFDFLQRSVGSHDLLKFFHHGFPLSLFSLSSSLFVVPDLDLLFSLISLLESSWHTVSAEKSTTPLSQYSKQTDTRATVVHVRTCVCLRVPDTHTHTRTYTKRLIDVLYIEHFETN